MQCKRCKSFNTIYMGKGTYVCDDCGQVLERQPLPAISSGRKPTPYERTRAAVYATGNKWAIENLNATH